MTRKGANMKLVNQGVGKGPLKRPIALPIIAPGIGYDTFHPHRDIVAPARRGPPVVRVRDCYGKSVRVEKHLLGVKPKSAVRIERTMSPVSIHLAQLYVGDEGMPVVIGAMPVGLQRNDPCGPGGILVIEKEQLKNATGPARIIPQEANRHRTYHYWHAFVPYVQLGQV